MIASEAVYKVRTKTGLNKGKFAKLLGLTRTAIHNYEEGTRLPRQSVVKKLLEIAKKHRVSVNANDFIEN